MVLCTTAHEYVGPFASIIISLTLIYLIRKLAERRKMDSGDIIANVIGFQVFLWLQAMTDHCLSCRQFIVLPIFGLISIFLAYAVIRVASEHVEKATWLKKEKYKAVKLFANEIMMGLLMLLVLAHLYDLIEIPYLAYLCK